MDQLSKNTVKGTKQLEESKYVAFESLNDSDSGKKIMFVGNSMTLHGVAHQIGWNGCFGMAASAKENDYVHVCMKEISTKKSDTSYCICQVCEWESNYKNPDSKYYLYESAQNFGADIIIMRAIENCPPQNFDKDTFKKELDKLLNYLNSTGNAKIVLTTGFWKHPGDDTIKEYAQEKNLPCIELGDLGEDDSMKAIGKFEHEGVANHPGDLGMKKIAERILKEVLPLV